MECHLFYQSNNIILYKIVAKSPVFTHLNATLTGLSTVRAYNAEKILQTEFDLHQDTHSACWYMFIATSSAFGLSLDIMCFVFISFIMVYFMLIDPNQTGEKVGLAITQAMTLLGMLQWGIRQSAEISNQMMSVERVLEYRDLEKETEPEKPATLQSNWPSRGCIEFRNVTYKYFEEAEPVLRGISFLVHSKEKIGNFSTNYNLNDSELRVILYSHHRYCWSNWSWKKFSDWCYFPVGLY